MDLEARALGQEGENGSGGFDGDEEADVIAAFRDSCGLLRCENSATRHEIMPL